MQNDGNMDTIKSLFIKYKRSIWLYGLLVMADIAKAGGGKEEERCS